MKCLLCKKPKGDHLATKLNCPMGKKHRTLGYTAFNPNSVYFPPKVKTT